MKTKLQLEMLVVDLQSELKRAVAANAEVCMQNSDYIQTIKRLECALGAEKNRSAVAEKRMLAVIDKWARN